MEQAIEQVLNPETSKALIEGGHVWIYAFQLILIAVLVPIGKWFVNYHTKKTAEANTLKKELIDAERATTKLERDQQMKEQRNEYLRMFGEVKAELKEVLLKVDYNAKEQKQTIEAMAKVMNEIGNKVNQIFNKMYNIS